ncbi:flagellar cap protein FliD N-terminal domain-containing protein [Pseudarthrobacter sp. So.54]
MGISLDGLASGLDTTALIGSLMQVEAIPQTQLKNKSYEIQTMVSALQGLNTKVAALATQASAAAKPGALDLFAATLSSDKVTATTTAAAKAGSIDFTVTKLAQTQVAVTNKVVGWPYTTMTITSGGQSYTVTPLTSSLDDVVSSVNAAGAAWWPARWPLAAVNSACSSPRRNPVKPAPSPSPIPEPRSPTSRPRRTRKSNSGPAPVPPRW